jgi:hypothetical protein
LIYIAQSSELHMATYPEGISMKISALVLVLAFTASGTMAAEGSTPGAPMPQGPLTADEMANLMLDFTRNAEVLKDPQRFLSSVMTASEPSFLFALGNQMLEPGKWAEMSNSIMNPASYNTWMPLATDPVVYAKWMAAAANGDFNAALISQLSDPAKMLRWMMAPTDPRGLELLLKTLNPATNLRWMTAPIDPRLVQAGMAPMNPTLYMGWMGTGMNPATYGNPWTGFAAYPYAAPVMMPMQALPATVPYGIPPQGAINQPAPK